MLLGVIAVPLALTLRNIPNGSLIIEVCVIVLAFSFTCFILFFEIWHGILRIAFSFVFFFLSLLFYSAYIAASLYY